MMRYRLLDTTRAYALDIGIADAERDDLAVRHAAYYRRWVEQNGSDWSRLSTGTERASHFANLNNVRAALEWCFGADGQVAVGNVAVGIALAAAAAPVFLAMSLLPECHRWSERALLALDDNSRGGHDEMQLQAALGVSLMFTRGNSEQSRAALERGMELAEKFHDPVRQYHLISQMHMFHRRAGNFDRMLELAKRSEAVAKEIADPVAIAASHSLLGVSHHLLGNQAQARAHVEAALARSSKSNLARASGFGFHPERTRIVLARTLWLLGYPEQAVRIAHQTVNGLAGAESVTHCIVLLWGACVFHWTGDLASVETCIERLIPNAQGHSLAPYLAIGHGLKGELLIRRGKITPGIELMRGALATLHRDRYGLYATEFSGMLAEGLAMQGRVGEALVTIDEAIAQVEPNSEMSMPELLRIRGAVLEKAADERGAEESFVRSLGLADRQSALSWRLRASTSLARLLVRQGRREEARKALAETYARFGEGFETADLKAARQLLTELG
jgi:predicted ATPase